MPLEAFKKYNSYDGKLDAEATLTVWARQLNYLFQNLDQSNIASTTLTLGSNQVKASNIDFGVGANQVDASDIPVNDPGNYYATGNVEGQLQEVGKLINSTGGNTVINSTASMNINSTDGTINVNSDVTNINSTTINIGSTSGYTTMKSQNLYWENTVYDDIKVPAISANAGTLNAPNLVKFKDNGAGSQGVYTYQFDAALEEELLFAMQIPHSYKAGTDLLPHIHWSPTTTGGGNVVWGLEYTIQPLHGTYANTSLITVTVSAGTTAYAHQVIALPNISGVGISESAMLIGRVYRQAGSTNDTYSADAALLELDFHYQKEKLGTDTPIYP